MVETDQLELYEPYSQSAIKYSNTPRLCLLKEEISWCRSNPVIGLSVKYR